MGLFDRSAFPEHLDTQAEVDQAFPDDSQFGENFFGRAWKWINKKTKHWDAFGPRSPRGIAFGLLPVPLLLIYAAVLGLLAAFGYGLSVWHFLAYLPIPLSRQWRDVPVLLFARKGRGPWRYEADGEPDATAEALSFLDHDIGVQEKYYLSRNQYWTRWHIAFQWPFFISAHWYKSIDDVIPAGVRADRDGRLWIFYFGAKRDADRIFWLWAFFIGRNFK